MRTSRYTLFGFICFFFTAAFNIGMGILVYSLAQNANTLVKVIAILGVIAFAALFCTIADYIRRKVMIERPLNEILKATELMARGNFKIRLIPHNSYQNYDEFDYIKEDLNKMANELSKSEVLKSDFIANVSHEIKTPLSVIQNYAKMLDDDTLSVNTRKKYLSILIKACNNLSNLVTNILKLNKLENDKLTPEIKKFNLSESLINQILSYEELIDKKKIVLNCDIEENLYITSEESYLAIIWNNLMSNAIKFTNKGGTISVSLKKMDDKYIVKVSDTGIGMDKETGKYIFDKFYQGDTSHSKEGNGLGLALVKRVITILGGSISVESEVGKGTTFKIIIKEEV